MQLDQMSLENAFNALRMHSCQFCHFAILTQLVNFAFFKLNIIICSFIVVCGRAEILLKCNACTFRKSYIFFDLLIIAPERMKSNTQIDYTSL